MDHNLIKSVQDTSTTIVEPITVQQVKDRARLEGFTATGGSELSFTDDDWLISLCIRASREQFEKVCGLTLTANRTKEAVITNLCGGLELPYGPVSEVTALEDADGNDVLDDLETSGSMWVHIDEPAGTDLVITYTCGYGTDGVETLPASIQLDLLNCAVYYYLNAGDETGKIGYVAGLAGKYSRKPMIL